MGDIRTKSIYGEKESSDGTRVLVSRYYPRGIKKSHFDIWMRHASPEIALLKEYKGGSISWDELSKRFRKQLRASEKSKEAIEQLVDLSENNDVITLLCFEKDGENCHRNIVKSIVESKIRRGRKKVMKIA